MNSRDLSRPTAEGVLLKQIQDGGRRPDLLLRHPKGGAIAGLSSGHADTYLVSLSECEGRRGDSGFESRFLAGIVVRCRFIVKHAPAVSFRYDPVFSDTHLSLHAHENAPAVELFQRLRGAVQPNGSVAGEA
jgi:hypothetical protein